MTSPTRAARAACLLTALACLSSGEAGAQRHPPRYAVVVEPTPATPSVPYSAYPGSNVTIDPRGRVGPWGGRHAPAGRQIAGPQVVYVPIPVDAYGYPVPQGAWYPQGSYAGGVTDVNGRPLAVGFETAPVAGPGPSYTPDFSGAPYVVGQDGLMYVALPGGERSFPACAKQAVTDPAGRPRTVFYSPSEYGLVLREGQAGRVQGLAEPGPNACYALDSFGRVALR